MLVLILFHKTHKIPRKKNEIVEFKNNNGFATVLYIRIYMIHDGLNWDDFQVYNLLSVFLRDKFIDIDWIIIDIAFEANLFFEDINIELI